LSNPGGKVDDNGFPTAKTARRQYKEEMLIDQMHKFHLAGANVHQICKALNISRATYFRFEKKAANRERDWVQRRYDDILVNKINWLNDALLETYTTCRNIELGINEDQENPGKKKVYDVGEVLAAGNLKCEVAISVVKLLREGPFTVVKEMPEGLKQAITSATQRNNMPQLSWNADSKITESGGNGKDDDEEEPEAATTEGDDDDHEKRK